MKLLLIILFPLTANSQDTVFWRAGNEASINLYFVQKSKDTFNWTTIKQVAKGKNFYAYVLPKDSVTNYYRIKATGKATYNTKPILLVKVSGSVTITNAKVSTTAYLDNLSWNSGKEVNILHYLIEKSINNGAYNQVTKVTARGYTKYTTTSSKTGTNKKYRVTAVFKDGTKGGAILFN